MARRKPVETEDTGNYADREVLSMRYERLTGAVLKLSGGITDKDSEAPAYAAHIPYQQGQLPKVIVAESKLADEARQYAATYLRKTLYEKGQDPRLAMRVPGLLAASPSIIEQARMVNQLKDDFHEAYMRLADDRFKRGRLARKAISGLHPEETQRKIPILEAVPNKITFTWVVNTAKVAPIRVQDAIAELKQLADKGPSAYDEDPEHFTARVNAGARALASLNPLEWLARRQKMPPHPRANIYFPGEDTPLVRRANLPFLYPDDGEELPPITPLGVMDTRIRRAVRRDRKVEDEPVVAILNLYRYKPEHRSLTTKPGSKEEAA